MNWNVEEDRTPKTLLGRAGIFVSQVTTLITKALNSTMSEVLC